MKTAHLAGYRKLEVIDKEYCFKIQYLSAVPVKIPFLQELSQLVHLPNLLISSLATAAT